MEIASQPNFSHERACCVKRQARGSPTTTDLRHCPLLLTTLLAPTLTGALGWPRARAVPLSPDRGTCYSAPEEMHYYSRPPHGDQTPHFCHSVANNSGVCLWVLLPNQIMVTFAIARWHCGSQAFTCPAKAGKSDFSHSFRMLTDVMAFMAPPCVLLGFLLLSLLSLETERIQIIPEALSRTAQFLIIQHHQLKSIIAEGN